MNIGAASDPVGLGAGVHPPGLNLDVTHLDYDWWPHEKFIQADAHNLPLPDQSYDMVVMGDIHEHLVDPLKATLEAARVARQFLVMTIFEEWRLPGHGQHIEEGLIRAAEEVRKQNYVDFDAYMAAHYPNAKSLPDTELPHHFHINQFDDEDISMLIVAVQMEGWRPVCFWKVPEATHEGHTWYNWLVAMERVK